MCEEELIRQLQETIERLELENGILRARSQTAAAHPAASCGVFVFKINLDMEEVGFQQNPKKWIFQTPAMVEFMADHVWDMEELMSYRIPLQ